MGKTFDLYKFTFGEKKLIIENLYTKMLREKKNVSNTK